MQPPSPRSDSSAEPNQRFSEMLATRDLGSARLDLERAKRGLEGDPEAALTSAVSCLEAVMRVYLEVRGLEVTGKPVLRDLWRTVSSDLFDDPMSKEDHDIGKVMTGFRSVIDGLAGIRDKASSAHGRGLAPYRVEVRHARLALDAATTFCNFLIDTWECRRHPRPPILERRAPSKSEVDRLFAAPALRRPTRELRPHPPSSSRGG